MVGSLRGSGQDSTSIAIRRAVGDLRRAATSREWSTSSTRRLSLSGASIRFLGSDVAVLNTRAHFNEGPVKEDRGTWVAVRQPSGAWLISALRVMPAARQ